MNRRSMLSLIAGLPTATTALMPPIAAAESTRPPFGEFRLAPNDEADLALQSTSIVEAGTSFEIIKLGRCYLKLDGQDRLTASVNAGVLQYARGTYLISLAVFDDSLRFLGASTHRETVQFAFSGAFTTMARELIFDFGVSQQYQSVARLAVAISDLDPLAQEKP